MTAGYKILAALLVVAAALGGSFYAGWHFKGTSDDAKADRELVAAIVKDGARVRTIDGVTVTINADFETNLTLYVATAKANAQEQAHVIAQFPSLAQCRLPDDLVRLRADQAAASAALAR